MIASRPDLPSLACPAGEAEPRPIRFVDIAAACARHGVALTDLPFSLRVLVENLERHRLLGPEGLVTDADVQAVVQRAAFRDRGLPLHVARVILPDSSGVPALQDLAALRDAVAARGGDPARVAPRVPVELVVDHSLQVDRAGDAEAAGANLQREFERNGERYRFLKWAQQAFGGLTIFPPGTGIIHQVNLEFAARVVILADQGGEWLAYPDFVIGGDSHTPMVNGIGVLGWGVGGIDAEAAMLGQAYVFPVPEVVGVELVGRPPPGVLTTDLALLVTQRLRQAGVTGCFVEYFGEGAAALSIPERATLANMAPEYGATCGFFAIDARTIAYLRQTRTPGQAALVEAYARQAGFFAEPGGPVPKFDRVLRIDLAEACRAMAGPGRPQDRLTLAEVPADFRRRLALPLAEGGFGRETQAPPQGPLKHGALAIAAITSCTNTSNPQVMLAAGLLARAAVERGMAVPAHVKTSLAPGSRVVTRYLQATGLMAPLEALGFHVIGYGCTTCGGKSGPLKPEVVAAAEAEKPVLAAALSGNRNFEGRIHRLVQANYIGSPPLVVAYALAGRIDLDLESEPLGQDRDGKPVFLRDLWPAPEAIAALERAAYAEGLFASVYGEATSGALWERLAAPRGARFSWDAASSYLLPPPFFTADPTTGADRIEGARVLGAYGDSVTTDHISPGGEIPPDSPAGQYLQAQGIAPRDFNSYVGRRGNFEVMTRATFANLRIKNLLVPDREGWFTRDAQGEIGTVYDVARAYRAAGTPMIVLGGRDYGTGSSRDWAAKGTALLGVRAVIAESFERIHRANLVGMGVVPLLFAPGEGWRQLGLSGRERFTLEDLRAGIAGGAPITVTAEGAGAPVRFTVTAAVLTESERRILGAGGMLPGMLEQLRHAA